MRGAREWVGSGAVVAAAVAIAVATVAVLVVQCHGIHLPQVEGAAGPCHQHKRGFEAGLQPHAAAEAHGPAIRRGHAEIGPVQARHQLVDVYLPGHAPGERPAIEHQSKRYSALRRKINIGRGRRISQRGHGGREQAGQSEK